MTSIWAPGTLYAPGSLVVPRTAPSAVSTAISNPGFESGTTDWTLGPNTAIDNTKRFAGTSSIKFTGTSGQTRTVHAPYPVIGGKAISAWCQYDQGAAGSGHNDGRVLLRWYDSAMVQVGADAAGNAVESSGGGWRQSIVNAVAPAGAAYVAIGIMVDRSSSASSNADQFGWNYATAIAPAGLVYRAVQPTIGTSADIEPAWPASVGVQVTDNDVIWEGVLASRVTWEAVPVLVAGSTEPAWPETAGQFVSDGSISWEAVTRRVTDARCPNSKVVAILASKVFAVDKDIVRFSATTNALDWSTPDDAGFLATGIQQANSNDMAVLAPYRSNLAALNASSFQNWQVDPDPAQMALLDQKEGIGSTWQHAAQPVADELLYLSQLGVRSIGMAAGTNNLAAGDAGMPIDPLVQAAISRAVEEGTTPVATYYPSQGQYWLAFPEADPVPPDEFLPLEESGLPFTFGAIVTGTGGGSAVLAGSVVTTHRVALSSNSGPTWIVDFAESVRVRITCQACVAQDGATLYISHVVGGVVVPIPNVSPTPLLSFQPGVMEFDVVSTGPFTTGLISLAGIVGGKIHDSQFLIEAMPL